MARIVGAESEEDYEAIPVSVRNAWRNTYRNIEDKEQSLESLKKAGVIDDDIYNSAKVAGYDGENFSDITPEQWREIYNGYIEGYNAFAKEHPDVPYRFRNQDRYRSQWDESYEGYAGKQQAQEAQPTQPTGAKEEAESTEEVDPLEVSDVQNKPFPEAEAQEPTKVEMELGEPQRLDASNDKAQPKQVTLPEEEQEEYRRNGGIFNIAMGARNDEPAQVEKNEEQAQAATQPAEKAATPDEERGYTPVAPWQKEQQKEEGRGYGYNIFDDLRQMRQEEENPTKQPTQQATQQPTQNVSPTQEAAPKQAEAPKQSEAKLPAEEQQEYVDNGGRMPIDGTNSSYARQRRNGNAEPVRQAESTNSTNTSNATQNAEEPVVTEVKPIKQEAPKVVQVTDNSMRPRTTPVHIQTREEWDAEQAENADAGTAKSGTNGVRTPAERTTPVVKPIGTAKEQGEEGMTRQREQPATTNAGNTQTGVTGYQGIIDYINRLNKAADDEEAEGKRADEEKVKRAAKRRMLLAGIADAANSFHQAYAYARGIKPMNDNKGYAKEVKKELRDDLEWMRKNKDRVLNFRAKAAEWEKALSLLKNQDRQYEERISKEKRAQRESDAKIKAYEARANKDEGLANLYLAKAEAVRNGDVNKEREIDAKIKVYESQERRNDASANAANALAEQRRNGMVVEEQKTDETGMSTKSTKITKPANTGGTNGGNTPPSRRNGNNSDNVPPSRRK